MYAQFTDDLGLSDDFLRDMANGDDPTFDYDRPNYPHKNYGKFCVCGRRVDHFEVYAVEPDPEWDPPGAETNYGGIIGVDKEGRGCCSLWENMSKEESQKYVDEFNARAYCALAAEV